MSTSRRLRPKPRTFLAHQLVRWAEKWLNREMVAAYLLGGSKKIELELACHYVTEYSTLHRILDSLWDSPSLKGVDRRGFNLWFTTTAEA